MKKVFNLRIECNSPTFVMTDKEFCQGLEEVVADEFDEEMKYVKLKAEPCDKDEQLAIYKRALELACENIRDMYCSDYCMWVRDEKRCKEKCCYKQYYDKEKILDQAKEKLEKGDIGE